MASTPTEALPQGAPRGGARGAHRAAAAARPRADPPLPRPRAAREGPRGRRVLRRSARARRAHGPRDGRRPGRRPRRHPARPAAPHLRVPRRGRGRARRARQPGDRLALRGDRPRRARAASRCATCTCPVERYVTVVVEGKDANGNDVRVEAEGLQARVLQHELDHLDGVLIFDRTTPEARREAMRALRPRPDAAGLSRTRVGFAGTSAWAADALALLAGDPALDVALVLTQPDRPAGRGRALRRPAGRRARGGARHRPACSPSGRPTRSREIEAVAASARWRSSPTASSCRARCSTALPWVNLHPSMLPRWRGAAPIERAIMAGEDHLASCVILLVQALDAGPIAGSAPFVAGRDEDARRRVPPRARARRAAARGRARRRRRRHASRRCRRSASRATRPSSRRTISRSTRTTRWQELHAARARARRRQRRAARRRRPAALGLAHAPGADAAARRRPAGCASTAGACCSARATARSSCVEVQPSGKRRMEATAWARGLRGELPMRRERRGRARDARGVAYEVVRRALDGGAYADRALDGEATRARLDAARAARSRRSSRSAPCSACARSTARSSRRPAARPTGSSARCCTRCGSARSRSCSPSSVPDRAAVSETVELVRSDRRRRARPGSRTRSCARSRSRARPGTRRCPSDARRGRPAPLAARLDLRAVVRAYGAARARSSCAARANIPARVVLRPNPLRAAPGEVEAAARRARRPVRARPGARRSVIVTGAFDLAGSELLRARARASRSRSARPRSSRSSRRTAGERVLDLCAAPGGKTAGLAATGAHGHRGRAATRRAPRRSRATLERLGAGAVEVVDGRRPRVRGRPVRRDPRRRAVHRPRRAERPARLALAPDARRRRLARRAAARAARPRARRCSRPAGGSSTRPARSRPTRTSACRARARPDAGRASAGSGPARVRTGSTSRRT